MDVFEFYEKLKQHCNKTNKKCTQCCVRLFCYISPNEMTNQIIQSTMFYLTEDEDLETEEK